MNQQLRPGLPHSWLNAMKLQLATWQEVEEYLISSPGIIVPVGSTEQHGPNGIIGTDALCAEDIAHAAAKITGALVAPTIAYSPAPFNMGFAGTVSLSVSIFQAMATEIFTSLGKHGFSRIYVLNAHGANLAPLRAIDLENSQLHIRSWWDFDPVNIIRDELFGVWEGMHATPSEISITQNQHRIVGSADYFSATYLFLLLSSLISFKALQHATKTINYH